MCDRCGVETGNCECPECQECGEHGCLRHTPLRELQAEWESLAYREHAYRRELESLVECSGCHSKMRPNLKTGDPVYCDACGDFVW